METLVRERMFPSAQLQKAQYGRFAFQSSSNPPVFAFFFGGASPFCRFITMIQQQRMSSAARPRKMT